MAEFLSKQTAKFVTNGKGILKLLSFDSAFTGEARNKGKLETSNLFRFQIKANQKNMETGETMNLIANLPLEDMPTIIKLSEIALRDKIIDGGKLSEFSILLPETKPTSIKVGDKFNCYSLGIKYDPKFNASINILITNFIAPVETDSQGRTNVKYSEAAKKQTFYMNVSVIDWYNQLMNAYNSYTKFIISQSSKGYYDDALGIK